MYVNVLFPHKLLKARAIICSKNSVNLINDRFSQLKQCLLVSELWIKHEMNFIFAFCQDAKGPITVCGVPSMCQAL